MPCACTLLLVATASLSPGMSPWCSQRCPYGIRIARQIGRIADRPMSCSRRLARQQTRRLSRAQLQGGRPTRQWTTRSGRGGWRPRCRRRWTCSGGCTSSWRCALCSVQSGAIDSRASLQHAAATCRRPRCSLRVVCRRRAFSSCPQSAGVMHWRSAAGAAGNSCHCRPCLRPASAVAHTAVR